MITRNKFPSLLWNSVKESGDRRYRHRVIKAYANKQNELIEELKFYVQKAHEDARQCFNKLASNSLDPLGSSTKTNPAIGYPERLHMQTLKGYFGEVFAGLIAEHFSPFNEDKWKVPAFLFRFHLAAFQHLEKLRQVGGQANPIPGRTGDDCLAFRLDSDGHIVRSLYCEAKCTADHHPNMLTEAHKKVSESVIVDIPQLIEVLRDSSEPDAPQWIEALHQLRLGTPVTGYERYDLVSYICRPPIRIATWLSRDRPHPTYTAQRRLEAVEVHLTNVEDIIHAVYG